MDNTQQIAEELMRRSQVVGGKPWGADKQKPRIYLDSGKGASVYFGFPQAMYEPSEKQWDRTTGLGPCELRIYIDQEQGQAINEVMDAKEKLRDQHRSKTLAIMAMDYNDDELAEELAKAGILDDEVYENLFNLLSEGKVDAAHEVLVGAGDF
jgi:hypothetical protein